MQAFWQDVRFGLRMLARNPGFSVAAILALALGIGANTAIFSMVNGVLLRQLPFRNAGRVVWIWESRVDQAHFASSVEDSFALQRENTTFDKIGAFETSNAILTERGDAERLPAIKVSASMFDILGAEPVRGRFFLPEEGKPGRRNVVVISYGLWQRRFGGDSAVIGQGVTVNGETHTVIGILPATFALPGINAEVYLPNSWDDDPRRSSLNMHFLGLYGRMKPGIAPAQAQADLTAIILRVQKRYPDSNFGMTGMLVVPIDREIAGNFRAGLLVLLGAVFAVLLITCANLASLSLARSSARHREIAIRVSLGAARSRIFRQLLTESLLIALAGGALGALLAFAGTRALLALSPAALPRSNEIYVDARVLGITLLLSVFSGILFGLAPALQSSRTQLAGELNSSARGSSEGRFRNQTRSALVAAEVAVSLVLLIGAGLLLRSFARLQAVRPGFDPSNVLTMRISLPKTRYPNRESIVNFYRGLAPRIAALPGVRAATATNVLPLAQGVSSVSMSIEGRSWSREQLPEIPYRMASPSYLRTLGVPLLAGRDFTEFDTATSPPVAIINETLARRYWTGENPVGAHVSIDDSGPVLREVEIVGVVGDIHDNGLDNPAPAQIFIPLPQVPEDSIIYFRGGMYWAIRTDHDPLALAGAVRAEIRRFDPEAASAGTVTLDQYLERSIGPRRFNLLLLGVFAVAALVLAVSGIYAVVAFSVARRTREIGIRVALGAQRREVLAMILGQGLRLVLAGLAAGLLGSLLVTRVLKGMLYGVSATDAVTFAGVALLLAATALAACYFPARRATRVDPLVALRYE